jgi:hypothetical protein
MQVDLLFRKIHIVEVSASTPPITTRMIRLKHALHHNHSRIWFANDIPLVAVALP